MVLYNRGDEMGRRISYEEIKECVEKEGYKILTNKIINAKEMFLVECSKGHRYETNYYRFKAGYRCPYCARNKKLTYDYVKEYIESYGYKLLSTTYTRALDKLTIQCPEGHIFERTFSKFKQTNKCPYCSKGARKFTYNEVKEYIELKGYKLLSHEYNSSNDKLLIKCSKGHVFERSFTNFKRSQRCPICENVNEKRSYEEVKKYIESFNYELLSDTYERARDKLTVKCPKGHIYNVTFSNFKTGYRCPECGKVEMVEKQKHSYDYVKSYFKEYGYELLSKEYKNSHTKVLVQCPEGHKYEVAFSNFKSGTRCPVCNINSKGEQFIIDYLEKHNIYFLHDIGYFKDLISNQKCVLRPDFILPKEKIWIEYDGEQHFKPIEHFGGLDAFIDLKIKDTMKNKYAEKHNWKLIRIPYWEFDNIESILNKELKIS